MRLFANLFRRSQLETTLDAELHSYLDEMTERKIREGLSPAEARRQALLETGGLEQIKEEVRATWLGNSVETTLRDIRYALRALLHSPGFTLVVVGTLALGIGANLVMFSIMHATLWRPLPYPEPGRLVMLQVDTRGVENAGAAPGELFDLRMRSRLLESLSMISVVHGFLESGGEMEHLPAASVSDDFLPLLGAHTVLGRPLQSQLDEGKTRVRAVLISDALWHCRFHSDPTVIGRSARINNTELQIVGVLAPGFHLFLPPSVAAPEQIDIWFPATIAASRDERWFPIAARLKPGVTVTQANAELQSLAAQFVREHPDSYPDGKLRLTARLLPDELTKESRPALFLLGCAVVFVLLIACVNVANLMLARGSARRRELAIRRAVGAGLGRIVRQLLAESLILALPAGTAGLGLAFVGLEAVTKLGNSHLPMQSRITIDGSLVLFALGLSAVTSLLFGLLPGWKLASGAATDPLRAGRSESASSATRRLQRTLVTAEIALSIVPLMCAGLMLRSFRNLVHAPIGFDPTNVVTAKLPLNFDRFAETDRRWAVYREFLEQVRALSGVESVGAASPLPLASDQTTSRVARAEQPGVPGILATQQAATPGYLHVVHTTLIQGRDFSAEDIAAQRPVTIVDQRLAHRLWPHGAIGRHLVIQNEGSGPRQELEIVGVIAPVRMTRVRDDNIPHFVIPFHIDPIEMSLVIKTHESSASLAPAVRRIAATLQTGRAPFDIRPLSDYVTDSIGDTRFTMSVLLAFAIASVLLASVGLYGTLAYLIAQRKREFGIRLALGATVRGIVMMVLQEGVLLAVAGVVLGLAATTAVTTGIRQLLYNVGPFDGFTLLMVLVLVGLLALVATAIPAQRAARTDPRVSLLSE